MYYDDTYMYINLLYKIFFGFNIIFLSIIYRERVNRNYKHMYYI